jgi:hypothetical protein
MKKLINRILESRRHYNISTAMDALWVRQRKGMLIKEGI